MINKYLPSAILNREDWPPRGQCEGEEQVRQSSALFTANMDPVTPGRANMDPVTPGRANMALVAPGNLSGKVSQWACTEKKTRELDHFPITRILDIGGHTRFG